MTENSEQHDNWMSRRSTHFRDKLCRRNIILVLVIILLLALSIVLWQMDIDWEEQIREYGYFGVFLLMLTSGMTIFFPLPSEAVLAITPGIMGLEGMAELSMLSLVASVGAALGEVTAYFAGLWGRVAITEKHQKSYDTVDRWMRRYGGPAIFVFSFTPLPFDLVGIAAGSLRFSIWRFLFYCWVGRLARALLVVHLGRIGWGIFFG